jgi:plastocyanin
MKKTILLFSLVFIIYMPGFSVRHVITNNGTTFSPDSITINILDTVEFTLANFHNAVEVSKETYDAGDTTSNGGFRVPFGGGKVAFHTLGVHYYVCQPHASIGMKGVINVVATRGTHVITNNLDFQFVPDSIHIEIGDTVYFSLLEFHNVVEVSKETYDANGTESNGGFSLPFGGGMVTFAEAGVHYYVCQPHVSSHEMKGRIYVGEIPTGVKPISFTSDDFMVYPVPATDNIRMSFTLRKQGYVSINMIDMTGKVVANILSESQNSGTHEKVYSFDQSIKPGVYFLRIQPDTGAPVVKQIIVQ